MDNDKIVSRLIYAPELIQIVPYSLVHIRRLEDQGNFPKKVHLGANKVGWVRTEVDAWMQSRIDARK